MRWASPTSSSTRPNECGTVERHTLAVDTNGNFTLDGVYCNVRWTKQGLKVGCHVITREALERLNKVE